MLPQPYEAEQLIALARSLIFAARIELVSHDLSDAQERHLWQMVGEMESCIRAHAVSLEDEREQIDREPDGCFREGYVLSVHLPPVILTHLGHAN